MKAKISASLLKSLVPRATEYEVQDDTLPGFLVRVHPSGRMVYVVRWARGKRYTIGPASRLSAAAARREAEKLLAQATLGQDPLAERRRAKAATLAEFVTNVYRPWCARHFKSDYQARRILAAFPDLATRRLGEITPWLIQKHRVRRLEAGITPGTVNKEVAALKAALGRAVEWGLLTEHPLATVRRVREPAGGRVRWLSAEEEQRLRQALADRDRRRRQARASANRWRRERGYPELPPFGQYTDHLTPLVLLALNSGLRRGELFNLRWDDLDLDRGMLTVQAGGAKTGRTRHVPLNQEARAVLAAWRDGTGGGELVFPGEDGGRLTDIKKSWAAIVRAARLGDFRFHDVRHTFASKLVMAGTDLYTVSQLLGHSSLDMTQRYAHLAPDRLQAAVERLTPAPAGAREEVQHGRA